MHRQEECETDDIETCLADSRLRDDQRHLLAVMLKWQRGHIAALRKEHCETDRRVDELARKFDSHMEDAAPALQLLNNHEKMFQRMDAILRLAFCKSWQIVVGFMAAWLVVVELAEHIGWLKR